MVIVVLAGGNDQIALICELKKRGHEVILVDYFQNPPAKPYADKHIVASTLDPDAVRKAVVENHAQMLCTACTDQALLVVAQISEELGLPCYLSYEKALQVTNKSQMKSLMEEYGIPTSRFIVTDNPSPGQFDNLHCPLVVKPVDCNSSKGVFKVESHQDLSPYVEKAIGYSRTKTAVVEEYVAGDEISADFFIDGHTAKLLCATRSKKVKNVSSFTIIQSQYPALSPEQEMAVQEIGQKIADGFHISNAPLLVQLIAGQDTMSVLEFSARMGGGSKHKLIEVLTGVNIMEEYVKLLFGEKPTIAPVKRVNYAASAFIYCQPGTIAGVSHLDELQAKGVIDHHFMYKTPGMSITQAMYSGDRAAGYIATAATQEELDRKLKEADDTIKVLDDTGKDMMIHGWI